MKSSDIIKQSNTTLLIVTQETDASTLKKSQRGRGKGYNNSCFCGNYNKQNELIKYKTQPFANIF